MIKPNNIYNMDYENVDQFGYEIIVGFRLSAVRKKWDVTVVPTNLNMQEADVVMEMLLM